MILELSGHSFGNPKFNQLVISTADRSSYDDDFVPRVMKKIQDFMETRGGMAALEIVEVNPLYLEFGAAMQIIAELQRRGFKVLGPHGYLYPTSVAFPVGFERKEAARVLAEVITSARIALRNNQGDINDAELAQARAELERLEALCTALYRRAGK